MHVLEDDLSVMLSSILMMISLRWLVRRKSLISFIASSYDVIWESQTIYALRLEKSHFWQLNISLPDWNELASTCIEPSKTDYTLYKRMRSLLRQTWTFVLTTWSDEKTLQWSVDIWNSHSKVVESSWAYEKPLHEISRDRFTFCRKRNVWTSKFTSIRC